ncbi:MAG: glycosyltransferase [Candidatus Lokiarchaeota archaeon]|nr:glycosyltransferase [Candidatus Lokiarchaeota archaeon]
MEWFGIVFIETNYYNLPLIGSISGSIAETISNGENGFLIKPNNLNDLIKKNNYLYNNRDL